MAEAKRKQEAHPQSAPGDFYVVNGECITCGSPHEVAPDLIGWADGGNHCIWKKQPETPEELEQAFAAFHASCCGSFRYAGSDPEIMHRIPEDSDQIVIREEIAKQEYWDRLIEDIRRRQRIHDGEE